MVVEALALKSLLEAENAEKEQERAAWRKEKNPELENLR